MKNKLGNVLSIPMLFLAGFAVGVGAGLLMAPRSGKDTRKQLKNLASETGEQVSRIGGEAKQAISGMMEQGKTMAGEAGEHLSCIGEKTKEMVSGIVEHGRGLVR